MNTKKPPDKYRTIKISLKQIIKNEDDKIILNKVVFRVNQLITHAYQFLRLWILNKYEKNKETPLITKDIIGLCLKVLTINCSDKKYTFIGPKPKGENQKIFDEFINFNKNTYSKLGYDNPINGTNLSAIFNYVETEIITSIENNIKLNFFKYVNKYVNESFKNLINSVAEIPLENLKKKNEKLILKELNVLKKDLKENTKKCDSKYHMWLDKNRNKILPIEYKHSYIFDINHNPQKYLKYMIYMNVELEKMNDTIEVFNISKLNNTEYIYLPNTDNRYKLFQFFPLRTSGIPKYCTFDSKALVDLFIKTNKNTYLCDLENKRREIWTNVFNMDHKIFKDKNYVFDYNLSTDGFGASLRFIHKSYLIKQKEMKQLMKNERNRAKNLYKNLSSDEINKLKENNKTNKKQHLLRKFRFAQLTSFAVE